MEQLTILSYLAPRHTGQVENLATDGLAYVLSQSSAARETMVALVREMGSEVPAQLTFRGQRRSTTGRGIVDLQGIDGAGGERVIIEAKFYAGLTENQPFAYLDRLAPAPSALLFVAPERRLPSLWSELVQKANDKKCRLRFEGGSLGQMERAFTEDEKLLAVVSWRWVLDALGRRLEEGYRADHEQLVSLTERMDSEEILPFTREELGDLQTVRRMLQFSEIIERTYETAARRGIISGNKKDLKLTSSWGDFGRYFHLANCAARLSCYLRWWAKPSWRETPFWLALRDPDSKRGAYQVRLALEPLERERPPRLFVEDQGLYADWAAVPLLVPEGELVSEVVESLLRQLGEIKALLQGIPPVSAPPLQESSRG